MYALCVHAAVCSVAVNTCMITDVTSVLFSIQGRRQRELKPSTQGSPPLLTKIQGPDFQKILGLVYRKL